MGNSLQKLDPKVPTDQNQQEQLQRPNEIELENQEFTCEICIEPTNKKFKNTNKCSHPFCTDCIIKYITVKLEDNNEGHIKCPALNCDHTLDPFSCSECDLFSSSSALFLRWSDVLCEEAIRDSDKCYCPYNNCNELILNECGRNFPPKKCKCPSCKRFLCFQCKSIWHAGFKCHESTEAMRDSNNVAFGRLVEQRKWSRCPRCRHFVESRGGCSAIKCRCGIRFCYNCGVQFRGIVCGCKMTQNSYVFDYGIIGMCALILMVALVLLMHSNNLNG